MYLKKVNDDISSLKTNKSISNVIKKANKK